MNAKVDLAVLGKATHMTRSAEWFSLLQRSGCWDDLESFDAGTQQRISRLRELQRHLESLEDEARSTRYSYAWHRIMQSYLLNVSFPPGVWIAIAGLSMMLVFLWSKVSGIGVSLGYFVILAGIVVVIITAVVIYFQQRIQTHYAVQRVLSVRDECAQEMLDVVRSLRGFE